MSEPVLTPELALNCNSDISSELWIAIAWDQANSDVADWQEHTYWSKIAGQLSVRSQPARREIVVLSAAAAAIAELNNAFGYQVLADSRSAADGSFSMQWSGYQSDVITLYLDDFGVQWQPNTAHAEGDIVFPSIWSGWQYECVNVGVTGSSEPEWWRDEGETGFSGTAVFKARQYLPALADGPLTPYQWSE